MSLQRIYKTRIQFTKLFEGALVTLPNRRQYLKQITLLYVVSLSYLYAVSYVKYGNPNNK